MQTNIDSVNGLNQEGYLRTAAEQIVTSCGSPIGWGSSDTIPESLGLAKSGSSQIFELDVDKICRLNNECSYSLSYLNASKAAKLDVAFGITITQMLSIIIEPLGNSTIGETTTYNFRVTVKANLEPTEAIVQGYIITKEEISSISNTTSTNGIGNLSFQLPNSSNGTTLMVLFARATIDDRLTAYQAYSFNHLSEETSNETYLNLSPLNNRLTINLENSSSTTIDECYALSFIHQSEPPLVSTNVYEIPELVDKSPIILVTTGHNDSTYFIEYCAYPNVPLSFGSDFKSSGQNTFVYTVNIKSALYKLTVTLGDATK